MVAPGILVSMAVQASLRIRHDGCVTLGFTGETSVAQVSAERGWDVFVMHAASADQLSSTLKAWQAYVDHEVEVLSRSDTGVVFRGHNPPDGLIATIREAGSTLLWPAVYRDGFEYFTVLSPSREAVGSLLEDLEAFGDVDLERLSEVGPGGIGSSVPLADLASEVTERQIEVLRAAIDAGYYEQPRRTDLEALADGFGIAPSTLREHLRKAEERLLSRISDLLEARDAVAPGKTRGRGRPPKDHR